MIKVIVTGGCGYKGHILVPKLLDRNYYVKVIDICWFGNHLPQNKNLLVLKKDIRKIDLEDLEGFDIVIHLSSIANDPCGDLNPKLTWEVSALATQQLADLAKKAKIKQFIYASSGSVYGIKKEDKVTEELKLEPLTEYNKTKMVAERVLLSYANDYKVQIIRPATVCGYSPRMRFDVSVNLLTAAALFNGKIKVLGGSQIRPNIHIQDIANVYLHFIDNNKFEGIFNAGFENLSILDIAKMVSSKTNKKIEIETNNDDPRSYRLDSQKLLDTGFIPKYKVEDAIEEIVEKINSNILKNEKIHHNLKWMNANNFAYN
tara:strand:- start:17174 stop:18124 length:951 start_codon:yes stop_codon:yes gene_type:complete